MNTNKFLALLVLGSGLLVSTPLQAQEALDLKSIDTILEDNMLNDVANRYSSVILSFLPEEATRLGYSAADTKLDARTAEQHKQVLAAFKAVKLNLDKIEEKRLSPEKKIELSMLRESLDAAIVKEEQKQILLDPLYYTQALDSVHDILLKPTSSIGRQKLNLLARLEALPEVATKAEDNLTVINPVLAERAMEKAYYAFLSLNEWNQFLLDGIGGDGAKSSVLQVTQNAKNASKRLFAHFKKLSEQSSTQDFRMGQDNYVAWLRQYYQAPSKKPIQLLKYLDVNLQQAQNALTYALEPFLQPEEEEEVTIVEGDNTVVTKTPARKKTNKRKKSQLQIRNAQDFYATAKTFMKAEIDPTPLQTLQKDAQDALNFFVNAGVIPAKDITFNLAQLPQYYVLATPYLFVPPYVNQSAPESDFFLRIPAGNELNQQTLFDQDFNAPMRKLMISGQLVPGRYYQAESTLNTSTVRRSFPAVSLLNGWEAYAKRLAREHDYLNTNEDLLTLAWDEYLHALAAYTDALLHTKRLSYEEALEFLTQTHGLEKDQAETMIRDIAAKPGEAVSYLVGLQALENIRNKYSRKFGKKFNEADFHAKLFRVGNVPPALLEQELDRVYKEDKKK